MSISLYDASVGSYLQIIPAASALLEKAAAHFTAQGLSVDEIPDMRIHPDMLPVRFQVVSVAHHSIDTIESMRSGVFGPPAYDASLDFAALKGLLANAHSRLAALDANEVNAMAGKSMAFVMGDLNLPFTTENFVLSFSLPNFHFHATTLYDIFRHKGLSLSKRDYMGKLHITR